MTGATPTDLSTRGRRPRLPAVLALALAVVGVLLITLASCGSRSGPPQPAAAAAGVIDGESSFGTSQSATGGGTPPGTPAPAATTAPTVAVSTGPAAAPRATGRSAGDTAGPSPTRAAAAKAAPLPSFSNAAKGLVLESSAPVSLSIPVLGVKSALISLGLNPDGTVQVPSLDDPNSKAGWYKGSPTPGAVGPAIILGHIDSKKFGPGVFYKIGTLRPGQEVDVTRQDGTVAVFRIDGVRSYPKDKFPTTAVYGNIDHAGLRLITCGGTFDPDKGSYESNIIAYASLKSSHRA